MPLTVENSPELLNEVVDMATQKTQRVKVTRGFYQKGELRGPGSVLDLPISTAIELRTADKVEFVQSDTKLHETASIPPPTDANPAPKEGGKSGKGAA